MSPRSPAWKWRNLARMRGREESNARRRSIESLSAVVAATSARDAVLQAALSSCPFWPHLTLICTGCPGVGLPTAVGTQFLPWLGGLNRPSLQTEAIRADRLIL